MDLKKAERSLRVRGAAHHEKVGVKIVPHGDGYGVETTVDGDRRYPIEEPMPIEEAIRLALAQLVEPRGTYEYVPTKNDDQPAPPISRRPYIAPGDLIKKYKSQGLDKYRAWNQFIIETILQPAYRSEELDAKEFYKYFERL